MILGEYAGDSVYAAAQASQAVSIGPVETGERIFGYSFD
jgi:hypothetical protein